MDPWKALKEAPVYEEEPIVVKKKVKKEKEEKKKKLDEQEPVDPMLVLMSGRSNVNEKGKYVKNDDEKKDVAAPISQTPIFNVEVEKTVEKPVEEPVAKKPSIFSHEAPHVDTVLRTPKKVEREEILVVTVDNLPNKYDVLGMVSGSYDVTFGEINEVSEEIATNNESSKMDEYRKKAYEKMLIEAKELGATAIIDVNYQMIDLMGVIAEFYCSGTAVKEK